MYNSNTSSGFNDDLNDLICHGPDLRPRTFVQRYWTFFEQHLCGRIIRKVMPISSGQRDKKAMSDRQIDHYKPPVDLVPNLAV